VHTVRASLARYGDAGRLSRRAANIR
jgi:hypothetical protein